MPTDIENKLTVRVYGDEDTAQNKTQKVCYKVNTNVLAKAQCTNPKLLSKSGICHIMSEDTNPDLDMDKDYAIMFEQKSQQEQVPQTRDSTVLRVYCKNVLDSLFSDNSKRSTILPVEGKDVPIRTTKSNTIH